MEKLPSVARAIASQLLLIKSNELLFCHSRVCYAVGIAHHPRFSVCYRRNVLTHPTQARQEFQDLCVYRNVNSGVKNYEGFKDLQKVTDFVHISKIEFFRVSGLI
ncbi:hypothetical protein JYQ62_18630 [Nostoc sp. UHCC 0702]|nr:hypothetical protein JYQ62_18630 [Nostoc sp. UHCC 0702]